MIQVQQQAVVDTGSCFYLSHICGTFVLGLCRLAEHMLVNQAVRNGLIPADIAKGAHARQLFSGIYAVGDNPAADVRGAVQAGPPWVSVLVRTGVFHSPGPNDELDPAHIVVEDVAAAVLAVLHRSRSAKWHSMR